MWKHSFRVSSSHAVQATSWLRSFSACGYVVVPLISRVFRRSSTKRFRAASWSSSRSLSDWALAATGDAARAGDFSAVAAFGPEGERRAFFRFAGAASLGAVSTSLPLSTAPCMLKVSQARPAWFSLIRMGISRTAPSTVGSSQSFLRNVAPSTPGLFRPVPLEDKSLTQSRGGPCPSGSNRSSAWYCEIPRCSIEKSATGERPMRMTLPTFSSNCFARRLSTPSLEIVKEMAPPAIVHRGPSKSQPVRLLQGQARAAP
mmetsp:Transcript_74793/g.207979  ORF Transcript_74793/g.207979 Transcript_74793/m.207979 type:complete len:259 (-) Transcript_74793:7-783(-)